MKPSMPSVFLCLWAILSLPGTIVADESSRGVPLAPRRMLEKADEKVERWKGLFPPFEANRRAMDQALRIPEFPEQGATRGVHDGWRTVGVGIVNPLASLEVRNHFSGRATGLQYALEEPGSETYTLYLGTVGGGLWKLRNPAGIIPYWEPLSDNLEGPPSVGAFLVHPNNPDLILIGTGDTTRYTGAGLYRTEDGGTNWSFIDDPDVNVIAVFDKLAYDRTNPNRVLAAMGRGIAYSSDFGETWKMSLSNSWGATDVVQDPADPNRWLAGMRGLGVWEGFFDAGADTVNFNMITPEAGTGIRDKRDRIKLSFCESEPSHVYAILSGHGECTNPDGSLSGVVCLVNIDCASQSVCKDEAGVPTTIPCQIDDDCSSVSGSCAISGCLNKLNSKHMNGIYRSDDRGAHWKAIDSLDLLSWSVGFFTGAIAADPDDCDRVFAGMGGVQWTENGTATGGDTVEPVMWNRPMQLIPPFCDDDNDGVIDLPNTATCDLVVAHADQTAFLFVPPEVEPGSVRVINANDGGYYFYNWAANSWEGIGNTLGLLTSQTMIPGNALAGYYFEPERLAAGLQDNGVIRIDEREVADLSFVAGGDGGRVDLSADDRNTFLFSAGVGWRRYYSLSDHPDPDGDGVQNQVGVDCSLDSVEPMTVRTNPTPGFESPVFMYTNDDSSIYRNIIDPACGWVAGNSAPLPTSTPIMMFDMAHSSSERVFYVTTKRDGRLFLLDESDPVEGGSFGSLGWIERTPAVGPTGPLPVGSSLNDSIVTADRSAARPFTIYYTTGRSRPSRALISTDRGQLWRDVTGSLAAALPDANYWELVANPSNLNQLFLATHVGVFRTDNGTDPYPTWYRYMQGLPRVVSVLGIEMNSDSSPNGMPILHIGTYGRGFWTRNVTNGWGGRIPDGSDIAGPPLEVTRAGAQNPDQITLAWSPSCSPGDGDYAVYEGDLGDFSSHVPVFCSTNGQTQVTFDSTSGSHYYLVAPVASHDQLTTEGSLGAMSDGQERSAGLQTCYVQELGSCP